MLKSECSTFPRTKTNRSSEMLQSRQASLPRKRFLNERKKKKTPNCFFWHSIGCELREPTGTLLRPGALPEGGGLGRLPGGRGVGVEEKSRTVVNIHVCAWKGVPFPPPPSCIHPP